MEMQNISHHGSSSWGAASLEAGARETERLVGVTLAFDKIVSDTERRYVMKETVMMG